MDLATWIFFGLVAALAINQALARLPALQKRITVYLAIQGLNIGIGTGVLVIGLPGWDHIPVVRWIVGLLFFVHAATNMGQRMKTLDRDRRARRVAEREEKEVAIAKALAASSEE